MNEITKRKILIEYYETVSGVLQFELNKESRDLSEKILKLLLDIFGEVDEDNEILRSVVAAECLQTASDAILMIADATESAVRSLKTPTPEEVDIVIDKIIADRVNDGQLSDSPLTLKDLKTIASTFSRIIRGMQHERIKYQNDIDKEVEKAKKILPDVMDREFEEKIKSLENEKNEKNSNN